MSKQSIEFIIVFLCICYCIIFHTVNLLLPLPTLTKRKLQFLTLAAKLSCFSEMGSMNSFANPDYLINILHIASCIGERLLVWESTFLCNQDFIFYHKNRIKKIRF